VLPNTNLNTKKKELHLIRQRRLAKDNGSFFVPPEPKIALVVRIRGIMGVSPKVKKILRLLRLRQIHNAVFVRLTGPMSQMLKWVEPYIAYGYPNLKTVRELLYKKGFVNVDGQRKAITDNLLVEERLGKFNIVCMEDMVHEIFTCGPNFKAVTDFLAPFILSSGSTNKHQDGRVAHTGNQESRINELVRKML